MGAWMGYTGGVECVCGKLGRWTCLTCRTIVCGRHSATHSCAQNKHSRKDEAMSVIEKHEGVDLATCVAEVRKELVKTRRESVEKQVKARLTALLIEQEELERRQDAGTDKLVEIEDQLNRILEDNWEAL